MEATDHIILKSLEPYRYLFPRATGIDHTVKKGATVSDTVKFMQEAARRSRWQVRRYVNTELKGLPIYDACKKLWHFVKEHIEYQKDDPTFERGKDIRENLEQVKSPRRLIADGKGDCDCMTNFVNACMLELGVKAIINRITAYDNNDFFQHIYSLVPDGKGSYIIMDCVWNAFNKEKKYTNKEDYKMELQFLDGIGTTDGMDGTPTRYTNMDAQDMFGNNDDFGELGRLLKKKNPEQKAIAKEKREKFMQKNRKVLNVANKINPATALLRAGILASMKLNLQKVAEALKWGYARREHAESKGMDMKKYERIKKVLQKIQNIFYSAGGKPESLRLAILKGRGNRNEDVAGFDGLSATMPLSELLGTVYYDEFVNGMEGFEGFGSLEGEGLGVVTAAAVATASTAMGALAALIKSIGNLFPNKGKKGKKGKSDEPEGEGSGAGAENSESNDDQEDMTPEEAGGSTKSEESDTEGEDLPVVRDSDELTPPDENSEVAESNEESTDGLAGIGTGIKAYYQANKKLIRNVAISLGIGTVAYLIYKSTQEKSSNNSQEEDALDRAIDGVKQSRKKRKKSKAGKDKQKSIIQLM